MSDSYIKTENKSTHKLGTHKTDSDSHRIDKKGVVEGGFSGGVFYIAPQLLSNSTSLICPGVAGHLFRFFVDVLDVFVSFVIIHIYI